MPRILQTACVFGRNLLFFPLYPALRQQNPGERLVGALEELGGPVYLKAGQTLAARRWFDGPSQAALERTLDNTTPLPFEVIRETVERSLGMSIDEYFDPGSFEQKPYGSASIAQTHIAYWHGIKVMVKVRRPNVLAMTGQDLCIARVTIKFASYVSKQARSLRSAKIPETIERSLYQEADLRNEARNITRWVRAYPSSRIVVPKVVFASEELLIETFLEGVPINRWDERYRNEGYDPQTSLRVFLSDTFGKYFRGKARLIHGDPNLANIIVMKGGKVGLVDFGLVEEVTEQQLYKLNTLIFAVFCQNAKDTRTGILDICDYSFATKQERVAFKHDVKDYVQKAQTEPFDFWLLHAGKLLTTHGIPAPEFFTLICRFGILAHSVAQKFFPHSSTVDLVGKDLRAGIVQRLVEQLQRIDNFIPAVYEMGRRLDTFPAGLARLIRDPQNILVDFADALGKALPPTKKTA